MGLFSGAEILSKFLEIGSWWNYTDGESKTELGKLKPNKVMGRAFVNPELKNLEVRKEEEQAAEWKAGGSMKPRAAGPAPHCQP